MAVAANPVSSTEGSSVTFTATMTPNTPTGPVLFQASTPTGGTIDLGSANLSFGVATLTTSTLKPGTWTIKVTYAGDSSWTTNQQSFTHTRKRKNLGRIRVVEE
jgi:hypothetical protein